MRRPTDSSGWLDTTPRLCHGRAHSGPRSHAALRRKRRAAAARAYHHRLARCRGNRELRANATSDRGRGLVHRPDQRLHRGYFRDRAPATSLRGLVAPLTFIGTAYVAIFAIGWDVGTDAGAQFFFLVAAALVVLLVGIEHTALAVGPSGGRRRSGDCPGVPGPARYWASAALGHVGKFRPHDRLRLRGSGRNGVVRAA